MQTAFLSPACVLDHEATRFLLSSPLEFKSLPCSVSSLCMLARRVVCVHLDRYSEKLLETIPVELANLILFDCTRQNSPHNTQYSHGVMLKLLSCLHADVLDLSYCKWLNDEDGVQKNSGTLQLRLRDSPCATSSSMVALAPCFTPRLRILRFANAAISKSSILAKLLSSSPTLVILNLTGARGFSTFSLEALGTLRNLKCLSLAQCSELSEKGLRYLCSCLDALEVINFGWCDAVSDDTLRALSTKRSLRRLCIASTDVSDQGLQELCKLPKLVSLDVASCRRITDLVIRRLAQTPSLAELSFGSCPLIKDPVKFLTLVSLNMNFDQQISSQFRFLPGSLKSLAASGCRINDRALDHLRHLRNLIELDISYNEITDQGLNCLTTLKKMRKLNLSHNNITGAGIECISNMTHLTSLNIDSKDITDVALQYLKETSELRHLNLACAKITNQGIAALSSCGNLTSLQVCGGHISDTGLTYLSALSCLRDLNLSQNRGITNQGLRHLKFSQSLAVLNLSNTGISIDFHLVDILTDGLQNLSALIFYGIREVRQSILRDIVGEMIQDLCSET